MDINYYKKYEPIDGKWYFVKELGSGAFGTVFEVERRDFSHAKSAIKIITIPSSSNEVNTYRKENYDLDEKSISSYFYGFVEEFTAEFKLMSKLRGNSNIVSIEDYDVKEHEDEIGWDIFIRMELLTPINKYFKDHGLNQRDVIKLGIDICKALEVCQKYKIIHRDIKPSNIFVSDTGEFKLGDFGVARTLEKTSRSLSKKGTYTYMAPEIYRGEAYGSNIDIYSLGIVIYKLLNNNFEPFRTKMSHTDEENALICRMRGENIPVPANADGRLAEIILKACSFNPKDRYESPLQMREELENILYSESEVKIIYPNGDEMDYEDSTNNTDDGSTVSIFDSLDKDGEANHIDVNNKKAYGKNQSDKKENCDKKNKTRKIFGILAIVSICLIAALILYFNFSEKQKATKAFNFLNNGQYSEAITEFDELIAKDGKNISAYAGKAMAQISAGEDDSAADTINTMFTTCDTKSVTKKDTYFDTVFLSGDGTDETFTGTSSEGTDNTPEPTPPQTSDNGSSSTAATSSPLPTPTPTSTTDSEDPFGRVLQFLFQWICRYNILNDQADQNEILMEMIEENGLNALYDIYSRMDAPTTDCPSGTYNEPISVTLSSSSDGTICYIMGEGEFRIKDSLIYEEPISVKKNNSVTHIMAVVYDSLYIPSKKLELTYELNREALAQVTYSHEPGNYSSPFGLTLSNPNGDGKIYYTTDGSEPTAETKEYSGKISVGEGTTNLKVKIIDSENDVSSGTLSLNYTVKLPEPTSTPIPKRNGPTCPACGSTNTAFDPSIDAYKCYDCGRADTPEDTGAVKCPKCGSNNVSLISLKLSNGNNALRCFDCNYAWDSGGGIGTE